MLLSSVKDYLNITTSDLDTFLTEIIHRKKEEFKFIFKHNYKLLVRLYQGAKGLVARIKPMPTTILNAKLLVDITDTGIPIPVSSIEVSYETLVVFNQPYHPFILLEGERGWEEADLPKWLVDRFVKLCAIEFKRSFKGEGGLLYSGRTVGDATIELFSDMDGLEYKLKTDILSFFYTPDEIREEFI
ncbi:MAG: hypothetical protein ABDH28_06565 [Brevinematia bacterium]